MELKRQCGHTVCSHTNVLLQNLTGKAEHAAPWPSALGMAKVPVALP